MFAESESFLEEKPRNPGDTHGDALSEPEVGSRHLKCIVCVWRIYRGSVTSRQARRGHLCAGSSLGHEGSCSCADVAHRPVCSFAGMAGAAGVVVHRAHERVYDISACGGHLCELPERRSLAGVRVEQRQEGYRCASLLLSRSCYCCGGRTCKSGRESEDLCKLSRLNRQSGLGARSQLRGSLGLQLGLIDRRKH